MPIDPVTGLAIGSAVAGGLSSLFKKNPKWKQLPNRSSEQMQGQSQALQQALAGLQNPYAGFEPIAQQAQQRFQSQTVPSLAERFTSLGGQGGQRSSAFQGALGQAGAGLNTDLAALQAQYGLANRSNLLKQLGIGLQPSFENSYGGGPEGQGSELFGGLSNLLGGLGQYQGQKAMNAGNNKAFFDFLKQYKDATGSNEANFMPQQGAAATVQSMFAPQTGQSNFNNFIAGGGNQRRAGMYNPMNQGY